MFLNLNYRQLGLLTLVLGVFNYSWAQQSTGGSTPIDAFAVTLAHVSEKERVGLLDSRKELITPALRKKLISLGAELVNDSRYEEASDLFRLALTVSQRLDEKAGSAESYQHLAQVDRLLGKPQQALEYLNAALSIYQSLGDMDGSARTLLNIGRLFKETGRQSEALKAVRSAADLYSRLGQKADAARALNVAAGIYLNSEEVSLAGRIFQQSLDLDPGAINGFAIASAFDSAAYYAQAVEYYQRALTAFENKNDLPGYAQALERTANAYLQDANYDLALDYYLRWLKLQREHGDGAGLGAAYMSTGEVYFLQGNLELAAQSFLRSAILSEEKGNDLAVAISRANLGLVRERQGQLAQAQEHYNASLKKLATVGSPTVRARVQTHIGDISFKQGNYAAALTSYQVSLSLCQEAGDKAAIATAYQNTAMAQSAIGNYSESLNAYQKAVSLLQDLGGKEATANALVNVAGVYERLGEYEKALDFAERAVQLAGQTTDLEVISRAWFYAGKIYGAVNRPADAKRAFSTSIDATEESGVQFPQAGPARQRLDPFIGMIQLLVRQNRASEALIYSERAKTQTLRDILNTTITKGLTASEKDGELRLRLDLASIEASIRRENQRHPSNQKRLLSLEERLRKTRSEYAKFERNLYSNHPQLKVWRGQAETKNVEALSTLLSGRDTVLAEYFVTDERTYLFVVTSARVLRRTQRNPSSLTATSVSPAVTVYTLPVGARELKDRISQLRSSLTHRDQNYQKAARELYDLLILPAEKQLLGKQRLVIVPDADLWDLPFQALQPRDSHYLIEDKTISYASTLSALSWMASMREASSSSDSVSPRLVAFATDSPSQELAAYIKSRDPEERSEAVPHLEREARTVERIFGAKASTMYLGPQATASHLKTLNGQSEVTHIAVAGLLDNASPMYSLLAFAGDNRVEQEGSAMWLKDIMQLNLRTDLVVLSAAGQASGPAGPGPALMGMSWAWFVAGSPATIINQGPVESENSIEFLGELYRGVTAGRSRAPRLTKSEALRAAAMKLLGTSHRHPYYWADFKLIGDPR